MSAGRSPSARATDPPPDDGPEPQAVEGGREAGDQVGLRRLPPEVLQLVLLLVTTRMVLLVIGLVARAVIPGPVQHPGPLGLGAPYSRFPFLDVWGQWDTSWYLSIAQYGYRAEPLDGPFANYAFFPLYPMLARGVGWVIGSAYVGGLVVSNVSLVVACVFLYRLVGLDHDEATARRAVKYLVLSPVAFIFSAMLTESLYVALVVMCFYFAKRQRWWVVAALGLLVALTRVPGVLLALPLAWLYLQQRGWSIRRVRPDILAFASFPLGLGLFVWFNQHLTGDPLAFARIQETAWGHRAENPLPALLRIMTSADIFERFAGWYSLVSLVLVLASLKRMGVAYGLFALSSILLPLSSGGGPWGAMPRYILVIFPLAVVAARFTAKRSSADQALTIALAMTQGFLMAFWANNSHLVV